MKAIETKYKGYRFRSRLEARWAVFFDALDLIWEYEPEGYTDGESNYLPDFYLPEVGRDGQFIEIKPTAPSWEELYKAAPLVVKTQKTLTFLIGYPKMVSAKARGDKILFDGVTAMQIFYTTGTDELPSMNLRHPKYPQNVMMDSFLLTWCWDIGRERWGFHDIYLDKVFNVMPKVSNKDMGNIVMLQEVEGQSIAPSYYTGDGREYRHPELLRAYEAARCARFEHGESPNAIHNNRR